MRKIVRRGTAAGIALAAAMATIAAGVDGGAMAATPTGQVRDFGLSAGAIADRYIVVLKNRTASSAAVKAEALTLTSRFGGTVTHEYTSSLRGFSARMSAAQAKRMAARAEVAYVEQDRVVKVAGTQSPTPSWGLDRIDQPYRPLDSSYTYAGTASTVHAYIIDTGIRISHTDFGGRATYGYNFVDGTTDAADCMGHGTHVAGTVGGTGYGVAKQVQLVAVKVLDCDGFGTTSQVIAGVDWVTGNAVKPAVANMSLGGSHSDALDAAVADSIATGITYAIAAGNSGLDACAYSSPADVASAITVGATDSTDTRPWWSNFGRCLDVFAPGVGITSAWILSDTATIALDGTSMASPHVAGAAALILADHPDYTPAQVRDAVVGGAVTGAVDDPGIASPNKLLQVGTAPATPAVVIRLRAHANNRIVTAAQSGTARLIANRVMAGTWEEFDEVDAGGGYVALRAHSNGRFVSADAAGAKPLINNRTAIGEWEKFQVIANGDGSLSLRANANGRYVSADNAGAAALIANRTAAGVWEKFDAALPPSLVSLGAFANFEIVTADHAGAGPLIANRNGIGTWEEFDAVDLGNGYIGLHARANGKFVTAENAGKSALIANRAAVGGWEQFMIVYNTDGTVSLKASANGRYVTAASAGTKPLIANRTAIGSWEEFALLAD
ncbi:MAG: hypothetical protein V7603_1699 [Micromonosporaceae bacterium]